MFSVQYISAQEKSRLRLGGGGGEGRGGKKGRFQAVHLDNLLEYQKCYFVSTGFVRDCSFS